MGISLWKNVLEDSSSVTQPKSAAGINLVTLCSQVALFGPFSGFSCALVKWLSMLWWAGQPRPLQCILNCPRMLPKLHILTNQSVLWLRLQHCATSTRLIGSGYCYEYLNILNFYSYSLQQTGVPIIIPQTLLGNLIRNGEFIQCAYFCLIFKKTF